MKFINFFKHLHTVNKHRFKVFIHCAKAGIFFQGLVHDLSKYHPTEFLVGVKYYQGTRSPNDAEREEKGMSTAWIHHKGRNKHHFEYWNDLDMKDHVYKSVKMPIKYVKEMFCDRIAACKIYLKKSYTDSSALDYYIKKRAKDLMHPETAKLLEEWLRFLSINGEKQTFKMIRKEKNY
ncbi:MAG: catalase [Bacilli bacterium]|nr:catalase [Bacilli bacterium]